jgi:hypothetical protein
METKPFDRELYDRCNQKGCNAALNLLSKYGYTLYDATERYKIWDLVLIKDGKLLKVEAEVSLSWKREDAWQGFPSLTCPYRKKDSKADLYIMTNSTQTCLAVIPMAHVKSCPIIRKNTKYTTNEQFFNISLQDVDFHTTTSSENRYIK